MLCEATSTHPKCEYYFDGVINGKTEIVTHYKKHIHPLVEQAMAGKSVVLLANSLPKNDFSPFFISDSGTSGSQSVIVSITSQFLKPPSNSSKPSGTLTFSWFKINCDKTESIVDILQSASGQQQADHNKHADSNLLLREVGRGRGMTVSGIWEVELSSGADIEAIMNHVLQAYPEGDNLSNGHSILQFIYTPVGTSNKKNATPNSKSLPTQSDAAGVGRFSFVVLSSLSAYDYNTLSLAKIANHPLNVYEHEWVHKLQQIIEWINSGRPSPPYHKSRLVLLLRDVLCSRQSCVLLQSVDKFANINRTGNSVKSDVVSNQEMQEMFYDQIHKMFQIMSSISFARDPKRVTSKPYIYENLDQPAAVAAKPVISVKAHPPANATTEEKKRSNSPLTSVLSKKMSKQSATVTKSKTAEDVHVSFHAEEKPRSNSAPRERFPEDSKPPIAPSNDETDALRENLKKKMASNSNDIIPSWAGASPPPPPPKAASVTNDIEPSANFNSMSDTISVDSDGQNKPPNMNMNMNRRKSTTGVLYHGTHGVALGATGEHEKSSIHAVDKEAMTYLAKALEESRKEANTLRLELEEANKTIETSQAAYNLLVDTIKQEGSMLKQKDRENYHKALRDLKDYAIYKEVIETAMIRLQNELDAVLLENKNLREESEKNLRSMRKKLGTSQRYDHYATNVNKKYEEAESKLIQLDNEVKKLAREKEGLQTTLTHTKAQLNELQDKYENEENSLSYNNVLLRYATILYVCLSIEFLVLIRRLNELENNPQFKKHQKKFGSSMRSSKRGESEENVSFCMLFIIQFNVNGCLILGT